MPKAVPVSSQGLASSLPFRLRTADKVRLSLAAMRAGGLPCWTSSRILASSSGDQGLAISGRRLARALGITIAIHVRAALGLAPAFATNVAIGMLGMDVHLISFIGPPDTEAVTVERENANARTLVPTSRSPSCTSCGAYEVVKVRFR